VVASSGRRAVGELVRASAAVRGEFWLGPELERGWAIADGSPRTGNEAIGESADYPAGTFRWALALCRVLLGFWVRLGSGTLR